MVKLPKFESADLRIVKEFVPHNREAALSAGRVIVRATNYGSPLTRFDKFFEIMAQDMLTFQPPIELDRENVEIVHYGGRSYSGTYGLEVTIPEGHTVPAEYARRQTVELTR